MAQRKTPASSSTKSDGTSTAAPGKAGAAAKSPAKAGATARSAARPGAARPGAPPKPLGRPPVKKKPGKSIVNQKQTPWGLILTTVLIVVFAAGIVTYAIASHKNAASKDPYKQPEIAQAKAIKGVAYKAEPNHNHVGAVVKYDTTPPTGGNHSPIWADCAGTVYPKAIANENAVHMLEHGAVWITYKPGLAPDQVATLSKLVDGVDRMALSPYPGLKTNISLQSWNYQLFVNSASDPRITDFITALRHNSKTTPENAAGVTCADPTFKKAPSTFGHPIFSLQ
ncbi:MAG: DUF3105 domain-containing protein [Actinomycetota bacterium]|nr:DUF3105 domain-containing protein [Actinomycetota bacterium]